MTQYVSIAEYLGGSDISTRNPHHSPYTILARSACCCMMPNPAKRSPDGSELSGEEKLFQTLMFIHGACSNKGFLRFLQVQITGQMRNFLANFDIFCVRRFSVISHLSLLVTCRYSRIRLKSAFTDIWHHPSCSTSLNSSRTTSRHCLLRPYYVSCHGSVQLESRYFERKSRLSHCI